MRVVSNFKGLTVSPGLGDSSLSLNQQSQIEKLIQPSKGIRTQCGPSLLLFKESSTSGSNTILAPLKLKFLFDFMLEVKLACIILSDIR